jgi:pilus assembly protein CpaE
MSARNSTGGPVEIAVITTDQAQGQAIRAAASGDAKFSCSIIADHVRNVGALDSDRYAAAIVNLDARNHADLVSLQGFMGRVAGRVPVIVVTETFDDAVARWFLQIRVADFLRKPVEPKQILQAVGRVLNAATEEQPHECCIVTFIPASGGVGATTLAIDAAMVFSQAAKRGNGRGCLVDLDFELGALADYLDLEARMDLKEILPHPDRLDAQLLEVMLSNHRSGLSVLATPQRPADDTAVSAEVVMRMLDLVSRRFDRVIVDLPRHWRPWSDAVLCGSNQVYVVTDMTVPGLRSGRRLVDNINRRLQDQMAAPAQVIVNRFEQTLLFGNGLRRSDVDRVLDGVLAGTVSNSYKLVREAIDRGISLEEAKPNNPVSTDMRRILQPLLDAAPLSRVA